MKKCKIARFLCTWVCICLFSFSFTVFADDLDVTIIDTSTLSGKESLSKVFTSEYSQEGYRGYFRLVGNTLYMSKKLCNENSSEKAEVVQNVVDSMVEAKIPRGTCQAIYFKINEILGDKLSIIIPEVVNATKADVLPAYMLLLPFSGALGIALGILVILLIVCLAVTTFIDLAYLSFPDFRNTRDASSTRPEGKPPYGVSRDAWRLIREYETSGLSGNIYLSYFGTRWVTVMITALAILYLVSGQISGVLESFFGLFSGIVG